MLHSKASQAAALAVGILLLAGCAPADPGTGESTGGDPVDGGTLTWAIPAEPTAGGVDPMVATSLAAQVINDVAYDTLLAKDDSGQIVPSLANTWEQPDELTWVFGLRDDVQFADGTEFTADDVVFTFETYQQATTSKRAYLSAVSSIEATGEHEVTFHFAEPDGTFLNAVSGSSTFFIVGRDGYGNATEEQRQRGTFGTGAFQVTDWADGTSITMAANEHYGSGDEEPHLDRIVFEVIPDESTRLAALQQGTAQAAYFLDGSLADQAGQSGYTVGDLAYTQNITVYLNPETGPLSDVRVRRAISLALDREALIETAMLGYGAVSFLPPSGDPEAPEIEGTPYYTRDVEEAKRLLAEAGLPNPEITLSYMGDVAASQHPIYEMMQQQLAEAGIALTLQAKPLSEIAPTFTAGESFEGLLSIPGTPKADPLYYFDALLSESGSFNYWDGNPDADRARDLWSSARKTTDADAYRDVIAELADEAAEQVLTLVPMAVPVYFEVWDADTLHGYESDPYYSRHHLTESWVTP